MSDHELLELAAKAAGMKASDADGVIYAGFGSREWNPLADDGDALRLSVKLRLHIDHHRKGVSVWVMSWAAKDATAMHFDEDGEDYAATRRAVVRAAAEIGRSK